MDNAYECPLCGGEIEYDGDFEAEYPNEIKERGYCVECGQDFIAVYKLVALKERSWPECLH